MGLDVRLRGWQPGDAGLLARLLGDPAMTEHIGGPESPEQLARRHARYLESGQPGGVYAVIADGEPAGWVGYWESEWAGGTVWETGWHVLREFQGRGVATAAMRLALADAARERRHRFVHAFPAVANGASNALCRTLGFELVGEAEVEYPPGRRMRSNDWRYDLEPRIGAAADVRVDDEEA